MTTVKTGIQALPLAVLFPHPLNPRDKSVNGDLSELAASMKERGQLQPLVVRPREAGTYEILVGHRRVEALRSLKRDEALADVREASDEEAMAIVLTENKTHKDVDHFREAQLVEQLVKVSGSVRRAAALVGESPLWVAQRLALLQLSPGWAKRRRSAPWSLWPLAVWKVITKLAPEAQELLCSNSEPTKPHAYALGESVEHPDLGTVETLVSEQLRVLGAAPFDVNSPTLVRAAGPCGSCPKTSQSVPGLFDEGEPTDLVKATCRDGACWAKKATAALRARIAEVSKEAGVPVPVVAGKGVLVRGVRTVNPFDWKPATEGAKGAVIVALVDKDGGVTKEWAKVVTPAARATRDGAPPPAKAESPIDRLARLEQAREAQLDDAVQDSLMKECERRVKDAEPPLVNACLAVLLVVGAAPPYQQSKAKEQERWDLAGRVLSGGDMAGALRFLWPDVVTMLNDAFQGDQPELTQLVATALGIDLAGLRVEVQASVKESPDLVQARRDVAPPAPPKKEKPSRGKGAAAGDSDADAPSPAAAKTKGKVASIKERTTKALQSLGHKCKPKQKGFQKNKAKARR